MQGKCKNLPPLHTDGSSLICGYASIRRLRTSGLGYFMLGNVGPIFEKRSFLMNISQNNDSESGDRTSWTKLSKIIKTFDLMNNQLSISWSFFWSHEIRSHDPLSKYCFKHFFSKEYSIEDLFDQATLTRWVWGLITSSNITLSKVIKLIGNSLWHHFVESLHWSDPLLTKW
jgi:hypothetical protein